ncbi:MAG TPA: hypothetical protein VHL77_05435 [Ferruginibacter sp.]|nr:hypothetical protein [Ferruginibacter sp.]
MSAFSFSPRVNSVTDYLGVPGPIVLNKVSYNLAWSAHPSAPYYKQEYIRASDKLEKFGKMIIVEVLTGTAKPIDMAQAKVGELKEMKKNNPIVNYESFQKNGEVLLDFLVSQNLPNGQIKILERNVYRYKAFSGKNGQKGVILFGASERSYDKAADDYLLNLKKNKSILLNAVAAFNIPEISLK